MRRGAGLAAFERAAHSSAQFSSLGDELSTQQIDHLRSQLQTFQSALRTFAVRHARDIRKDPVFRMNFQRMCASIGVDPLSGGRPGGGGGGGGGAGGFWADLLGLGDFQYELAIQIIDVCVSTRHLNGGLIEMDELLRRIAKMRGAGSDADADAGAGAITADDVLHSLKTLAPLGSGYEALTIGSKRMVRSVPRELDTDQGAILLVAEQDGQGFATVDSLVTPRPPSKGAWTGERARAALDNAVRDELCWVDEQAHPPRYYVLSLTGIDD